MNEPESRIRRRGVRASRIKLARALAEAGLKTQAALAERMADLEGLDAPPKDIVSRVFREQPVDPTTLERVARALQTEAYKLYLTAEEAVLPSGTVAAPPGAPPPDATAGSAEAADLHSSTAADEPVSYGAQLPATAEAPPPRRATRPAALWTALAIGLALILAGGWFWIQGRDGRGAAASGPEAGLQPKFGRFKVAITRFDGDTDSELAVMVRERLETTLGVTSAALPLITREEDRGALAKRFRVDVVLDGEIVRVGQLLGLRIFAYADSRGRREQIWGETLPLTARERKLPQAADNIAAAVHRMLGMLAGDSRNPPHFPLAPVQDEYLQGRSFLDQAPSEINLRRAAGHFESALRHDANFAAAHAALCETSLDAVWINEERQLADAEKACVRAIQLAPRAPEVLRAHAYFLNRSGRASEAMELLQRLYADEPDDVEVALSLANAEFDQFRRTDDAAARAASLEHARAATRIAPGFWKPWMWLGIYESGAGTADGAIAALERAHQLDPQNEYVVTNLGTMYFCRGDFDDARDLYLKARDVAPGSYAGTEFLGLVYYYLEDFVESARLRQSAIDMARAAGGAEIHQMWGSLADSYRQSGALDKAVVAYTRALEIVERDFLMGNGTIGDKAARAYYYLELLNLQPERASRGALQSLERDLEEASGAAIESTAMLRVAQSWLLKNEQVKAREALGKAMQRCRCYEQHPDLARLLMKD